MYKEQLHMCETNLYETQLRTKDEITKLRFLQISTKKLSAPAEVEESY